MYTYKYQVSNYIYMHKILFLRGIFIELNRAEYLIISLHTIIKRQHFVRNKIFSSVLKRRVLLSWKRMPFWMIGRFLYYNMCVPRPNNYHRGDYSFYIKK